MVAAALLPMYEQAARGRMAEGGGDHRSGPANLPDPIQNTGDARDHAAATMRQHVSGVGAGTPSPRARPSKGTQVLAAAD